MRGKNIGEIPLELTQAFAYKRCKVWMIKIIRERLLISIAYERVVERNYLFKQKYRR